MAPRGPHEVLRDRDRLIDLMQANDLGIRPLAREVECGRSTIQRLVDGVQTATAEALARRIETALGVAPGALFRAPEPPAVHCTCPVHGTVAA